MNPLLEASTRLNTRRQFFRHCNVGLGALALNQLLGPKLSAATGETPGLQSESASNPAV